MKDKYVPMTERWKSDGDDFLTVTKKADVVELDEDFEGKHPRGIGGLFVSDEEGAATTPGLVWAVARTHPYGYSIEYRTGREPKSGYMVAESGHTFIIKEADFTPEKGRVLIEEYMAKNKEALSGQWVGGWKDDEHGEFVFDVSHNISSLEEAKAFGIANDQQSMWDVVNQVEIPLGGTGQREQLAEGGKVLMWQMPDLTKMSDEGIKALAAKMVDDLLATA